MIYEYIKRHRRYGVIIDANLLLLFLIGSFKPNFIKNFKRTKKYEVEEFQWVDLILGEFKKVVITPHILAEIWNFVEKIKEPYLGRFIKTAIKSLEVFKEDYVSKERILSYHKQLKLVGVTDLSIIIAAKRGNYAVLTDDLRAYRCYMFNKVSVINLNHLKTARWF